MVKGGTDGASDGITDQSAQFTTTFNTDQESLLRSARVEFWFDPRVVILVLTGGTAGDPRALAPSAMGAGVLYTVSTDSAPSSAPATVTGIPPPVVYFESRPKATAATCDRKDIAAATGCDGATDAGMIATCQVQFYPGLLESINPCANHGPVAHYAYINKRVVTSFSLEHFDSCICCTKKCYDMHATNFKYIAPESLTWYNDGEKGPQDSNANMSGLIECCLGARSGSLMSNLSSSLYLSGDTPPYLRSMFCSTS